MSIAAPTIQELIEVAGRAVRGGTDKTADFVRGSDYESVLGPAAVIWSRQAQRDTDLFNAVNFNTAEGEDLTELVLERYGRDRVLDSYGVGTATLVRPSAGTAETIWTGTRLYIPGPTPKFYRVADDKEVLSTDLLVELELEAVELGPGVAADVGLNVARLYDVLEDSSWVVSKLACADGTLFESAPDFRARVREERREERVGQEAKIVEVCESAGATYVALFRSNYAGEAYDHSLNVVYVGNLGYVGTPELVKACTLALQSTRVLGDNLQVLPMARVELDVEATVYLYASPAKFDLARLERLHHASVSRYLNGSSGSFTYSLSGIRGAIIRDTAEVQRVELATPVADNQVVVGSQKNFPATLNRYVPGQISFHYDAV